MFFGNGFMISADTQETLLTDVNYAGASNTTAILFLIRLHYKEKIVLKLFYSPG